MPVFDYVLVLMFAILISNFINRFIPALSTPIIQIALGVFVALLPLGFSSEMDPNLFFILFIAPLLFNDGLLLDKKSLWKLRKPIMLLAFAMVFMTVIVIGFLINILIPTIPLAAAFALAGALAPTDAVAVISLGSKLKIPPAIMEILADESILNDASGVVSFQFALAAMLTGSFSIIEASVEFVFVALGGVIVGALLTFVKLRFEKWTRSLGMENVTLHILIGLLTPFLVYMISSYVGVSGILAVVASGLIHSFGREKIDPEIAELNIASKSIWETVVFVLNGMVFLTLGTQLPMIINKIQSDVTINKPWIFACIIIITGSAMLIRYVWSLFTIKKEYYEAEEGMSKVKVGLIVGLSGARGALTLATIMSVPYLLSDGSPFPQRDLILFIASGVILCSLLIANFILPLFLDKEIKESAFADETEACIEIVNIVIAKLNNNITENNKDAVLRVTRDYYQRRIALMNKKSGISLENAEDIEIKKLIFDWQREHANEMLKNGEIDDFTAQRYIGLIDRMEENQLFIKKRPFRSIKIGVNLIKFLKRFDSVDDAKALFINLRNTNNAYVLEKLTQLYETDKSELLKKYISDYELLASQNKSGGADLEESESVSDIAALGFQIERDTIQSMFEDSRISWNTAARMRKNIYILELQMQKDSY